MVHIIFDVVVIIVFERVWKQQVSFPELSGRKPPMFRIHPPDAIYPKTVAKSHIIILLIWLIISSQKLLITLLL